jgi:hypothetical protein
MRVNSRVGREWRGSIGVSMVGVDLYLQILSIFAAFLSSKKHFHSQRKVVISRRVFRCVLPAVFGRHIRTDVRPREFWSTRTSFVVSGDCGTACERSIGRANVPNRALRRGVARARADANGTVAAVITEDEGRSKLVHLALGFGGYFDWAVGFGEFAGFVINSR